MFTVLEASYTDKGNGDAPALTGTDAAEYAPHTQATNVYPLGEGTGLYTGQTFMQGPGHWFMFRNYDLAKVGAITMSISSRGGGGTMEVRADSPTGPLITSVVMPDTKPPASLQRIYQVQTAVLDPAKKPAGAHDLYFVTKWTDPAQHAPERRRSRRSSSTRSRSWSTRRSRSRWTRPRRTRATGGTRSRSRSTWPRPASARRRASTGSTAASGPPTRRR